MAQTAIPVFTFELSVGNQHSLFLVRPYELPMSSNLCGVPSRERREVFDTFERIRAQKRSSPPIS